MYTTLSFFKKRRERRGNTTRTVNVLRILKRRTEITKCTVQFVLYFIIYWLFAVFYSKYHFFYYRWYCMGGRERVGACLCKTTGRVYVSMWYFPPPCTPFLPAPSLPQLCPIFVSKACTHSSLLRSCQTVFFLFFCKTKTCNIITKLLSFSLPKSELLETLKSNKKLKCNLRGGLCLCWEAGLCSECVDVHLYIWFITLLLSMSDFFSLKFFS